MHVHTSVEVQPFPALTPDALAARLAHELAIQPWQAANTVQLLDAQNTIPFIARYRKEKTGELDEEQLRHLAERLSALRNLEERRGEVWRLLEEQGNLTPQLAEALKTAETLQRIEDLYLPYRPKRRTRASIAREKGLQPLADMILSLQWPEGVALSASDADLARPYVDPEGDVPDVAAAWQGAVDIAAEQIAENAEVRDAVRRLTRKHGHISSRPSAPEEEREPTEFEMYYDYREPVARIRPHRVLALNRGEKKDILKVRIEPPLDIVLAAIRRQVIPDVTLSSAVRHTLLPRLEEAIEEGYRRLLAPSIERELRSELSSEAETHAISIFAANLRQLLLQPPAPPSSVVAIDPGYRTGCKVAVVGPTGDVLDTATIYPHPPQNQWEEAKATLSRLIKAHSARLIAIGNGTASRETERLAAELIRAGESVQYIVVSEAGASVYSASPLAREELPSLDVSLRGAVSIGRRTQDPLAELVKIDPKSIGVGLYQHDVNQKRLAESLQAVVESCVNYVGVELNTASPSLLQYVSGINAPLSRAIVEHRRQHGPFTSRHQLLKVPRLGPKTFEQCAGFLRIAAAEEPLDRTAIHPESYSLARRLLDMVGTSVSDLTHPDRLQALRTKLANVEPVAAAEVLQGEGWEAGVPTVRDILEAIARPGRDPREDMPPPLFRDDVLELDDLKPGMIMQGSVSNVVDFGVFVDIGVPKAGLVHVSEMSDEYVRHPLDIVSVGDIVTVRVLSVDTVRGRIALSLRLETEEGGHALHT